MASLALHMFVWLQVATLAIYVKMIQILVESTKTDLT